ncbi:MAG: VacJ protein [Azospirillum sp.]|nr:VacJ protein [Azospirillum sp.]
MIRIRALVAALAALLTAGPAWAGGEDPWEPFNRQMFALNSLAVQYVIDPAATFLETWVPHPVRQAGSNIYGNLTEPEFIVTNLFVGDYHGASESGRRFVINSTFGLAGLWDAASAWGVERRQVEFGEALCTAGVPTGPYLVLPLIGPTNATSAGLITGFFTVEWYALAMISTLLATADLVVDLSASAASLRFAGDLPERTSHDPYHIQRELYGRYLHEGCPAMAAEHAAVATR